MFVLDVICLSKVIYNVNTIYIKQYKLNLQISEDVFIKTLFE